MINESFTSKTAIRKKAILKWNEEKKSYIWEVKLFDPKTKCCSFQPTTFTLVLIHPGTGKVLMRKLYRPNDYEKTPGCYEPCH